MDSEWAAASARWRSMPASWPQSTCVSRELRQPRWVDSRGALSKACSSQKRWMSYCMEMTARLAAVHFNVVKVQDP